MEAKFEFIPRYGSRHTLNLNPRIDTRMASLWFDRVQFYWEELCGKCLIWRLRLLGKHSGKEVEDARFLCFSVF